MGDEEGRDHQEAEKEIPKGYFAIKVGQEEKKEEHERFVVPVKYMNHPLFLKLLKKAEEEYGFEQDGPINIPCHPEVFRQACAMIDMDTETNHHHHDNHHHHLVSCFKA